jgi:hypothetical protein
LTKREKRSTWSGIRRSCCREMGKSKASGRLTVKVSKPGLPSGAASTRW